jgi:hypothetical protein
MFTAAVGDGSSDLIAAERESGYAVWKLWVTRIIVLLLLSLS